MSYIGIDTNVFLHLLNPKYNHDSHIDELLRRLIRLRYQLLVDSSRKIGNEYERLIVPIIRKEDETRPQLPLLRLWMSIDIRYQVTLDPVDKLMQRIKKVIYEKAEHADRAFVYVVCRQDAMLVTNDDRHILRRRTALLRSTRSERGPRTDIQPSRKAAFRLWTNGEER
jgi:hypothetical protein